MTAMRVIHTGLEHRPQVEPVFEESFEESGMVDATIREGGTETTPESRGPRPRTTSALEADPRSQPRDGPGEP